MDKLSAGMKVALLIMMTSFLYMFAVTFFPLTAAGEEHSKTIVGFLLGTGFGTLLNYYWGNSSSRNSGPKEGK